MQRMQWRLRFQPLCQHLKQVFSTSRIAQNDTIYALSSADGRAGVAVIRISGTQADTCLSKLTKSNRLPLPRVATFKKLHHPNTREHLDDAIAIRFPGPKSFTGEDVVELHVHGSGAVVTGVLQALHCVPGCRVAEAGEFTERAFDNQKLDLMQVEGLADLLHSETEAQRAQALRQLSGKVSSIYEKWREDLIRCMAYVEAQIDFGDDEDDVTDASYEEAIRRVRELTESMENYLKDERRGEMVSQGVRVAIIGPPNAGKSSLLNELAQRPVAIVSSIAGTTRDIVQVPLNLSGFPVIVSDTAGIRETEDEIEREGVLRAQKCAEETDILIILLDIQDISLLHTQEYINYIENGALVVLNKVDQVSDEVKSDILSTIQPQIAEGIAHTMSCLTGVGIVEFISLLDASIKNKLQQAFPNTNTGVVITRERHRQHLSECVNCLQGFIQSPYQCELAAEELRRAVIALGRILGRIDVEDVLDVLFKDFCIGK